MKQSGRLLALIALLGFLGVPPASGQTAQQPRAAPEAQQGPAGGDPIRQLNLSPEQREQIRSIREDSKAERTAIAARVGEAYRALEEALNSDNPDDEVIEQRVREVATAQAAAMRMRILTEVRIRRVLTVDQRNVLRALQQQARENRRDRLLVAPETRQQRLERREERQNRNGISPLFPRNQNQRKPRL
jgi:Spy/CpxP family protein refolding chaperone